MTLLCVPHGNAASLIWTNESGNFSDANKWDPAQSPVSGDDTLFTNGGNYTVTFTADAPDMALGVFTGQTKTVTLNMGAFTWALTNQLRVGRGAGSTATVYVASGTLTPSFFALNQIRVGDGNTGDDVAYGALIITNGTVKSDVINIGTSTNAVGKIVVTGSGVLTNSNDGGFLRVGFDSSGSTGNQLIITNGGKVTVLGEVRVGGTGTSNNLCLVSGPTSVLSIVAGAGANGVRVGSGGTRGNMLIISNGAKLFTANGGTIGGNGGGTMWNTAIVVGAGSAWLPNPGGTNANIVVGTNGGGNSNNFLIVYDGGTIDNDGTLQFGNASPCQSNTLWLGGTGAVSTGRVANLRFPGTANASSVNFTNSVFTTAQVALNGGSNNVVSIFNGATFTLSGSDTTFPNSGVATNNLTMDGGAYNVLVVNGGTLRNVSGSNVFGVIVSSGNRLIVTNGGKLFTEKGTFGPAAAYGTGIVVGVGSVWSNAGNIVDFRTNAIVVGTGAGGNSNQLAIADGGTLYNAGSLSIGNSATSTVNSVQIGGVGASSTYNSPGAIRVGSSAGADYNRLVVTNAVLNSGTIVVGSLANTNPVPSGTNNVMEIHGGSTVNATFVQVRGTNSILYTGGTFGFTALRVDGNVLGTATVNVASGATLSGVGFLANPVTVANGGIVEPGTSVGTLTVSNNLVVNSTSALNYELGSTGSADKIVVVGNLTLDGVLNIITNNTDGLFGVGNYTLMTYTGALTDNSLTPGTMPAGFSYAIAAGGGSVVLQVTAGGGGMDYGTWTNAYGLTGGNAAGGADPDGDGMINTDEFLAGFNPTNNAARLRIISTVRSGNDVVITYRGANGDSTYSGGPSSRTNVLEFTTGTATGSYTNNFVSTGQTHILSGGTGLGTVTNFVDVSGASSTSRYYRVRVLVP